MRAWHFSETAYPYLPPADTYPSIRVSLPNRIYDPEKGAAFNTACLSIPPPGQLGNAPRRFFYGPGMFNTDLTVLKSLSLGNGQVVQFRLEAFNAFNTAQFFGAGSVDGNVSSATFGQIVRAASPRLVQLAVKYSFR